MIKYKFFKKVSPVGYTRFWTRSGYGNGTSPQVDLSVVGLFDSHKSTWTYYAISVVDISPSGGNLCFLTDDILPKLSKFSESTANLSTNNISEYGMSFTEMEGAIKYVTDFQTKWETGSNNTIQENREKKLKELINE